MNKVGFFFVLPLSFSFTAHPSQPVQQSDQDTRLETIEVTAQKHPQAINKIPISIDYISGAAIESQQLKDTTELSAQSVNLKVTQNFGEGTPPAINIRGVGSMDYNTSTTSPVGIYLDNVAGGSANAQLVNLFDIQSVEVLRGPQGTLFGRNTNAGAILIKSQQPQSYFSGYLHTGFAQNNHKKWVGALNLPVNDKIASRLAISRQDYDYSVNNLYPQAPVAGMKQDSWRWSFAGQWQKLKMNAKVHGEHWQGIAPPIGNLGLVRQFNAQGVPESYCTLAQAGSTLCTDIFGFSDGSDKFQDVAVNNNIRNNTPHQTDSWGTDLHLSYSLDDNFSIESTSSFYTLTRLHNFVCDGSTMDWCSGSTLVNTDVVTQELRLHAHFDRLYLISGLFLLDEKIVQDNDLDLFRDYRQTEQFNYAVQFFWDNRLDTGAYAGFVHGEYQLNNTTTLSGGIRQTYERTTYRALGSNNTATEKNDQVGVDHPGWDLSNVISDGNYSAKLAVNHQLNQQLSAFVNVSRGFKSGGYNGGQVTSRAAAIDSEFGPETLNAFEFGTRYDFDDSNARLKFSGFYYDYTDQQVFMLQDSHNTSTIPVPLIDNVGESTIFGAEVDLRWQLSHNLRIELGAGYIPRANLAQYTDALGNVVKDNRLPFTSRWNANGLIEYNFQLNDSTLSLQLTLDHQSAFYFDQSQSIYAMQPDYSLFNSRIAWNIKHWTLSVWGKNITDRQYSHYRTNAKSSFGMMQDYKGAARQIGINIKYAF